VKKTVYLSLGSNLGDREQHLRAALARLAQIGTVIAISDVYETEPIDAPPQPWFLNCTVALETELMPKQLLAAVLAIERELGRRRQKTNAKTPRTIDIDILLFGASIVNTLALNIPHPGLHLRRFVLEPLAAIAPEVRHPVLKRTIRELRDALPPNAGAVKRVSAEPVRIAKE
jgi:2-amino-4-hydroxy-6-hydroxymethyldihydropteridine diphosphokinase